eukprot:2108824-Amphidinium_carterae.1
MLCVPWACVKSLYGSASLFDSLDEPTLMSGGGRCAVMMCIDDWQQVGYPFVALELWMRVAIEIGVVLCSGGAWLKRSQGSVGVDAERAPGQFKVVTGAGPVPPLTGG